MERWDWYGEGKEEHENCGTAECCGECPPALPPLAAPEEEGAKNAGG